MSHNLLGKKLDGILPETMVNNERLMYHMNMGFYTPQTQTPHSSVAYHEAEHKFYHPWSNHSFAKQYGYSRIKEIMPLKDYMMLPSCQVDEWIEGVVEGESARFELEKSQQDQQMSELEKQQAELAKRTGLGSQLT